MPEDSHARPHWSVHSVRSEVLDVRFHDKRAAIGLCRLRFLVTLFCIQTRIETQCTLETCGDAQCVAEISKNQHENRVEIRV